MGEWQLFEAGTIPEHTTAEWYAGREHAPHLEQEEQRPRLLRTATLVAEASMRTGARTVVDLGAGDGGLLSLLGPGLRAWGYDLAPASIVAAHARGVDVRQGDALGDIEWGRIAVATEMLEHLVDPHGFVRRIREHAEVLICSSPWRERPGSAYEFHAWAWDFAGYRDLVEGAGWQVARHEAVRGFQLLMAVRP